MLAGVKLGLAALTISAAFAGGVAGLFWTQVKAAPFAEVKFQTSIRNTGPLIISRDEVTTDIWNACHEANSCGLSFARSGSPIPVTGVNPDDIGQFIRWLNATTNAAWRLPTVTEQRAFSKDLIRIDKTSLFSDPRMAWAADYNMAKRYARDVFESGHFGEMPNGLRDVGGNVWEWTSSCVNANATAAMCPAFFVGGDHEAEIPVFLRDAYSGGCSAGVPPTHLGFRLVRDA